MEERDPVSRSFLVSEKKTGGWDTRPREKTLAQSRAKFHNSESVLKFNSSITYVPPLFLLSSAKLWRNKARSLCGHPHSTLSSLPTFLTPAPSALLLRSVPHPPAVWAQPGGLAKMQNLGPHLRPPEFNTIPMSTYWAEKNESRSFLKTLLKEASSTCDFFPSCLLASSEMAILPSKFTLKPN